MKKFTSMIVIAASCLAACGQNETSTPGASVVIKEVNSEASVMSPPQARMNFAAGKSLVIQRAKPDQLGASCQKVADVRKFRPSCRDAINKIAKFSLFDVSSCELQSSEPSEVVACRGVVQTSIGTAEIVASFRKIDNKWQGAGVEIIKGSWAPS